MLCLHYSYIPTYLRSLPYTHCYCGQASRLHASELVALEQAT